jgi:pimeloyl-ACP methyl ester carboxylesterase
MVVDPGSGGTAEEGGGEAFDSDGFRIAFDDVGEGPPVVLIHGFISDRVTNWRRPGWYRALREAGRRVIALDCRGHGESGKSTDPDDYGPEVMAGDVVRLLDHLEVPVADVIGYSMGARVAAQLLVDHPDRVNAAVLGGVGTSIVEGTPNQAAIAEALEADDADGVTHPAGRRFRRFAERQDADRHALAAAMRAFTAFDLDRLADVTGPVLVVAGSDDRLVDDPGNLADRFERGEAFVVPERDHMTTVGDPRFKEAVVDFLEREGL